MGFTSMLMYIPPPLVQIPPFSRTTPLKPQTARRRGYSVPDRCNVDYFFSLTAIQISHA